MLPTTNKVSNGNLEALKGDISKMSEKINETQFIRYFHRQYYFHICSYLWRNVYGTQRYRKLKKKRRGADFPNHYWSRERMFNLNIYI